MECWASTLNLTFSTTGTAQLSASRADRTLSPRKFLGTYLLEGEWATSLLNVDRKVSLKIPRTPSGIELGISRLVAQRLKQMSTTRPSFRSNK